MVYRTNPHVDMAARAADSADLLRELLAGERLARAFIRLPLVPPSVTLLTAAGPYAERIAEAEALMRDDPRIANASVAGGFVFSDLPKCGMTVTVTTRGGDAALARQVAARLARHAWAERGRHVPRLTSVDDAVALAVAAGRGEAPPVLLADVADNPGGGGRGSTTYLLQALHAAEACGVVLGVFVDPDLAAEAQALGEGAAFEAVFNRAECGFSRRFAAPARVIALRDGAGVGRRGTMAGRRFGLGPSALLELEGTGIRVVVGSLRRQLHEPAMLEMHGIDIGQARCVVVKSPRPFPRRLRRVLPRCADHRGGRARPHQPGPGEFPVAAAAAAGLPAGCRGELGGARLGQDRHDWKGAACPGRWICSTNYRWSVVTEGEDARG